MTETINFRNGLSLYILNTLTIYFEKIFFAGDHKSIKFMCFNDQSSIRVVFFTPEVVAHFYQRDTRYQWDYAYLFDSEEIKRNIPWFKNRDNAKKNQNLVFEFDEDKVKISNGTVDMEFKTLTQKPDIPDISKMQNGNSAKIRSIKGMIKALQSISEEVIQITLTESELKISGRKHNHPVYTVKVNDTKMDENKDNNSNFCHKSVLHICCLLADKADIGSPNMSFYHSGATQLSGRQRDSELHSILVAVK